MCSFYCHHYNREKIGVSPILSVIDTVTTNPMLDVDGGNNWHELKNVTCKQTKIKLTVTLSLLCGVNSSLTRNRCGFSLNWHLWLTALEWHCILIAFDLGYKAATTAFSVICFVEMSDVLKQNVRRRGTQRHHVWVTPYNNIAWNVTRGGWRCTIT